MTDSRLHEAEVAVIKEGIHAFRANLQQNECPACGAFRLDGRPALIHEHDCPYRGH
jgi:hypothetical protein